VARAPSAAGAPERVGFTAGALRLLLLATGMLTVVRVTVPGRVSESELRASTALYPLVGLAVGAVPAAVLLLPLPALPRAALALVAWVLVTGALHLDGWADCCDAAFAPPRGTAEETRARRLAILKDPHLGVFGSAGLGLLLLLKWSALTAVTPLAPLLAAPVARWAMVRALRTAPPARRDGLGAAFAGRVPLAAASAVLAAVVVPVVALPALTTGGAPLALLGGVAVGMLAGVGTARWLAARFGGVTGDSCGAAGEAAETVTLLALLPWVAG
jgi:adenosylcobinamide-GDP ribazoletransferase